MGIYTYCYEEEIKVSGVLSAGVASVLGDSFPSCFKLNLRNVARVIYFCLRNIPEEISISNVILLRKISLLQRWVLENSEDESATLMFA